MGVRHIPSVTRLGVTRPNLYTLQCTQNTFAGGHHDIWTHETKTHKRKIAMHAFFFGKPPNLPKGKLISQRSQSLFGVISPPWYTRSIVHTYSTANQISWDEFNLQSSNLQQSDKLHITSVYNHLAFNILLQLTNIHQPTSYSSLQTFHNQYFNRIASRDF
jgi:hypothetical protein